MRAAPRTLALAAALGLTLLPAAAGAQDEPGSGFSSYELLANAPGLGLGPLYTDVAVTIPEVTSSLTTGAVGAGLSSLAWPGPVLGNAGSTILVLQPQAPPESVLLNSPVRAEARTGGERKAANTTVPGTLMSATAEPDEVTAQASFSDTVLPVAEAGSMSSASRVGFEGAAKAVAEATTEVQDLSLAEGVITIGSVVSTASAASDGVKATAKGSTKVTGFEVAGVPVTVDGKGISVAGTAVPAALPQQAVNEAVKALGLQAVVTEPRTVTSGGTVTHEAGALVLLFEQGGTAYSLTIGRASVAIAATPGAVDEPLGEEPAAAPVSAPGPAAPVSGPAPVDAAPAPAVDLPAVEAPAAPVDAAPAPQAPLAAAPDPGGLGTLVPVAFALSGGAPAALSLVGLVAAGLLAAALRRLPDRVLAVPAVECDERSL